MNNKLNTQYDITHRMGAFRNIGLIRKLVLFRLRFLLLGVALCLIPTGCASFSPHMSGQPDQIGPPSYAYDPEANGNPEKTWWN